MTDLIENMINETSGFGSSAETNEPNDAPVAPTQQQDTSEVEQESPPEVIENEEPSEESTKELVEKQDSTDDFLKTHFPDVESIDDLKAKTSSLKTLEEENKALKEEINRIKESLKGFDGGIDPNYLRLQKIDKENPNLAPIYKKMMLGELSSKDYLEMSMIMDDPDLAQDKEMLDMAMEDKYPILFEEDSDPDSEEYKKAMKRLNYDAKKAEQRIRSEFDKIDVPVLETEEQKKEKTEKILNSWKDFNFKDKSLTTVKVSLDGEKGSYHFMDIEIPEAERNQYLKAALEYMINNGLEKGKDSVEKMQKLITGMWIGGNLEKYNRTIIERRAQMSDREWRKFIHNPKQEKTISKPVEKGLVDNLLDTLND